MPPTAQAAWDSARDDWFAQRDAEGLSRVVAHKAARRVWDQGWADWEALPVITLDSAIEAARKAAALVFEQGLEG